MQLPVDVKALMDEAHHGEEARACELAVSVYLDPTAPADVTAYVRSAFSSDRPNARITIAYLDDDYVIHPSDDMAVIVAGASDEVGPAARQMRDAGVPVMVVTTLPVCVDDIARAADAPIPEGDIVAPENPLFAHERSTGDVLSDVCAGAAGAVCAGAQAFSDVVPLLGKVAEAAGVLKEAAQRTQEQQAYERVRAAEARVAAAEAEPLAFDEAARDQVAERMGAWVVAACRSKKLAFAYAFSFVRRPLARDAVTTTSLQNAAVGLVPLIPGADLPLMTLNQAKMVMQIAAAYGQPLGRERIPEVAAIVANGFGCRALARKAVALVPGVGWVARPSIAYAGTAAVGCAIIEYFEGGGNLTGLAHVVKESVRAGAAAMDKVKGTVASA